MVTQENIIDIKNRLLAIEESVHIPEKRIELEELQLRMQDPEFWTDADKAQSLNKKAKDIEKFIQQFEDLEDVVIECEMLFDERDEDMFDDLSTRYEEAIVMLEDMELYNLFREEGDNMSCILTITSGAGGTEAQDWCKMLFRMYDMYCKNNDFKTTLESWSDGQPVGLKQVSILVEGEHAYGLLKCETGIHRLVRVSPFNAQGKRMTSFASVFVCPVVDDTISIELDNSKLSFDYFRCSGAGGQNVNKVNSGVRARYWFTDPETGETEEILVENTETRDQPKNKERAIINLKSILYKKELDRRNRKKKELEDSKADVGWGNQIRSYVMDDSRVKDHRTGFETRNIQSVMNGEIDGFIKSYLLRQF